MKKGRYKRITLDCSAATYQTLCEVAEELETTKANAIVRALGLMKFALDKRKEHGQVFLESGGNRVQIFIL